MMSEAEGRKGWRRIIAAVVLIGILTLVMTILVWNSLPRWHTYILTVDSKTGVALAVDYPDGWKLDSQGNFGIEGENRRITFKQQKPTGLALWWQKIVTGQRSDVGIQPTIGVTLFYNYSMDINGMEAVMKRSVSLRKGFKIDRTMQRLGPALNIEAKYPASALLGGRTSRGAGVNPRTLQSTMSMISLHEAMIFSNSPQLPKGTIYILSCSAPSGLFPATDAQFREMLRRLRIVQVPAHR